jgi:hypothetical protein
MAKKTIHDGGCWFCEHDDEDEPLYIEREFDCVVHASCVRGILKDDPNHPEATLMQHAIKNVCVNCNKPQICPDDRCDCRLEWQINKSFKLDEENKALKKNVAHLTDAGLTLAADITKLKYDCAGKDTLSRVNVQLKKELDDLCTKWLNLENQMKMFNQTEVNWLANKEFKEMALRVRGLMPGGYGSKATKEETKS